MNGKFGFPFIHFQIAMRETAVIGWISYFLLVEDIVFVIVLLGKGEWMSALMAIVVGIVFIFGFRGYARKKLKTF